MHCTAVTAVSCLSALSFGAARLAGEEPVRVEATRTLRQEIVVTNQNLALVAETRQADLPAGAFELLWAGVPRSARTETWTVISREPGLRWLGLTAALPGQRGQEGEWLNSLVGKKVKVLRPSGTPVEAEVLEVHGPTPDLVLFREGADAVYGEPLASILAPADTVRGARPAGVFLRFSNQRAGGRELTSRYLLSSLTWEANYSLTLAPDEKSGRLEGWFTIDNASGAEFAPNRLRLLAGVLRVAEEPRPRAGAAYAMAAQAEGVVAPSVAASESRVYEVSSPGRLRAGRTTLPLAEDVTVSTAKRYVVRSSYWSGRNAEAERVPVAVQYSVQTAPLARALPAGAVRVYSEQGSFFAGEDRIPHVPERTDFEIETSEAFDLSARRQQVSFQQTGPRETESAYEVTLTGRKKEDVTVLVRENLAGDWSVLESSVPATRRGAGVAEFALPVPAGGTAKLSYRVRLRTGG